MRVGKIKRRKRRQRKKKTGKGSKIVRVRERVGKTQRRGKEK